MMNSALYHLHILPYKSSDLLWCNNNTPSWTSTTSDSCLAEIVGAPGPGVTIGIDGEGMVGAGMDKDNLLFRQSYTSRNEGRCATTLDEAAPKLTLLAITPGKHSPFNVQCEAEVITNAELNNILEVWYEHRVFLK